MMTKLKSIIRRFPIPMLLLSLLVIACIANVRELRNDTQRQGWWDERGPVVPHDAFPGDCSLCHVGDDWHTLREDFEFDHLAQTGLALEGAHAAAECLRCHNDRGPVEAFASHGCAGCHEDFHQGKLGNNCADCHEDVDWRVKEVIAIHDRTRFPLVGSHASAQCWRCHEGARDGVFTRASSDCESCHQDDLARALMPDHQAQGFTSSCNDCHIPTTWSGAAFNHPAFRLAGAHAAADCTACHINNVFAGTPSDCAACHMPEYLATNNPGHVVAGISNDCMQCHGDVTWLGARYDHLSYQLTGAHLAQDCNACHGGGLYAGTSTDCFACHSADYNATSMPDHIASGFPTDCMACHSTNTWQGAVFNHSFPITSGKHKGFDCTDCHLVPTDFSIFTCTNCHGRSETDKDHPLDKVPGYIYLSSACLQCHPDGKE